MKGTVVVSEEPSPKFQINFTPFAMVSLKVTVKGTQHKWMQKIFDYYTLTMLRIKQPIILSIYLLATFFVQAQDLHFSQYFNAPLLVNPANTGFNPTFDYTPHPPHSNV